MGTQMVEDCEVVKPGDEGTYLLFMKGARRPICGLTGCGICSAWAIGLLHTSKTCRMRRNATQRGESGRSFLVNAPHVSRHRDLEAAACRGSCKGGFLHPWRNREDYVRHPCAFRCGRGNLDLYSTNRTRLDRAWRAVQSTSRLLLG